MVSAFRLCCLSSCSYIKPQLDNVVARLVAGCLSSCSYIKPQLSSMVSAFRLCCLSSCSYIKPQQRDGDILYLSVVYHLVPTSNHNHQTFTMPSTFVVYHLVPTSNHNHQAVCSFLFWLFIILFLHQTTTCLRTTAFIKSCLSSCSYIKPQPIKVSLIFLMCCLSSCSYIKPQRQFKAQFKGPSCLSSCSYIKPQQGTWCNHWYLVVYHLVPTSNHNCQV